MQFLGRNMDEPKKNKGGGRKANPVCDCPRPASQKKYKAWVCDRCLEIEKRMEGAMMSAVDWRHTHKPKHDE
jgi:hypothetical protein